MTDRNRPRFDRLLGRIHRPLPWRLIRAKPPPSAVIRGDDESINRSSDNTPGVVRATSTTAGIPASAEFKSEGGPLNGGTESSNNGAVNGRRDVSEMGFDVSYDGRGRGVQIYIYGFAAARGNRRTDIRLFQEFGRSLNGP